MDPKEPPDAARFFAHLFDAKSARRGGVVRRSLRDIDTCVGRAEFLAEIQRRGFSAVENGTQMVVFCNAQPVRLMAGRRQTFFRKFGSKL